MDPLDVLATLVVTTGGLWDIFTKKIPNLLTYPSIVLGLVGAIFVSSSNGFGNHFLGLVVGFLPFFLLYLQGGLGGGDVKLMAAVGA